MLRCRLAVLRLRRCGPNPCALFPSGMNMLPLTPIHLAAPAVADILVSMNRRRESMIRAVARHTDDGEVEALIGAIAKGRAGGAKDQQASAGNAGTTDKMATVHWGNSDSVAAE